MPLVDHSQRQLVSTKLPLRVGWGQIGPRSLINIEYRNLSRHAALNSCDRNNDDSGAANSTSQSWDRGKKYVLGYEMRA